MEYIIISDLRILFQEVKLSFILRQSHPLFAGNYLMGEVGYNNIEPDPFLEWKFESCHSRDLNFSA